MIKTYPEEYLDISFYIVKKKFTYCLIFFISLLHIYMLVVSMVDKVSEMSEMSIGLK
jgi:hypothetical protein